MYDPSTLPLKAGDLLLITDRLAAPADFLILGILTTHLRQVQDGRSVLVSTSQALSHWSAISTRLNPSTNLSTHIARNSLVFIDLLTDIPVTLRPLYESIKQHLQIKSDGRQDGFANIVILDGLPVLEWTGLSTLEIKRFLRALRSLCLKNDAPLIIRHHRISIDVDDIMRTILQQAVTHIEVLPLASGKSGAISGEIALHHGHLSNFHENLASFRKSTVTQYRLCNSGPTYFGKGTVAAIL